jgi:hypothetical protein
MDTNLTFTEPIYIGARLSQTLATVKTAVSINDYQTASSQNVCATIYNPSEETGFGLPIP